MPTPAIICQECGDHRPIYMDDPRVKEHAGHLTHQTKVWHGFEMWHSPIAVACPDDETIDPSWLSKRCSCPQVIYFGQDDLPRKACKLHGTPWIAKYNEWLVFQPFEHDMRNAT